MQAVRDGRINIVPKTWEKTFFNWMENIQPWCVSRQLWWGHRIPAWFDDDGNIFVAETEEEAASLAAQHHGRVAGASVLIVDDEEAAIAVTNRSEEHTSELQSIMRISYAVFCLKKKKITSINYYIHT